MLSRLGIPVGVDPDEDLSTSHGEEEGEFHENADTERSWIVSKWHAFDVKYMKPLFTVSGGQFHEVPTSCRCIARACCGVQPNTGSTEDVYRVESEDVSTAAPPPSSQASEMQLEEREERSAIA